jgi:nitroreductase
MIKEIENHRSVRKYLDTPVPQSVLDEILAAGTRASNTGNMQLYSMVVTTSAELRAALSPCHFNQPCVVQAPVHITFCADINRFDKWCVQRGATPQYNNFLWFTEAVIDASLASQNVALQAEAHGLGIVYLGTAIYGAAKIAEILHLPAGVVPVVSMAVGYPDLSGGEVPLTDRLPVEAVVHRETYHDYSPEDIDRLWAAREASPETAALLAANGLPNLARIFTERRYTGPDNIAISRAYLEFIEKQGFSMNSR